MSATAPPVDKVIEPDRTSISTLSSSDPEAIVRRPNRKAPKKEELLKTLLEKNKV